MTPVWAAAYAPLNLDGRMFALVPGEEWKATQAYEIKDGKATHAFEVRGWTYQFVKVR